MRRTFLSTGSPQTEDERWYVLQNWRQDVVAIIDEAAVQRERVFYSPYGRVFGMVAGDTDFDGHYGSGDSSAISGWAGNSHPYRAYADVDLDGDVDATDAGYTTNDNMGWDVLSRDGSTVGYAGYTQDDFIATVNHVRHRVLKTDLGRWVQRDPAGYVDGANLYEYVRSRPTALRDPSGLASIGGDCSVVDSCGGQTGGQLQPAVPPPPHYCEITTTNFDACKDCCRSRGHDYRGTLRCIGLCRSKFPPPPLQKTNWCSGYTDKGDFYDFTACCRQHDNCYYGCYSKSMCDLAFCRCVSNSCRVYQPGSPARAECDFHASRVCAGVIAIGWIGYDRSCKPYS